MRCQATVQPRPKIVKPWRCPWSARFFQIDLRKGKLDCLCMRHAKQKGLW